MAGTNDIRPLGAGDGLGWYWVQTSSMPGGSWLELIAINDVGQVTRTGRVLPYEPGALTQQEAITEHLGAGIAQADADLERRRKSAPAQEPEETPPPMDEATRKFYDDTDRGVW